MMHGPINIRVSRILFNVSLSVTKQGEKGDGERTKYKEKEEKKTHFRRKVAAQNLVTSFT